jgi:tetratricopeptide (TPR) repeat protein
MRKYCSISFLIFAVLMSAQDRHLVDSLRNALTLAKNDTTRFKLLSDIVNEIQDDSLCFLYTKQGKELCEKHLNDSDPRIKYLANEYLATHLGNEGIMYEDNGDYDRALVLCKKALEIQLRIGDKKGQGYSYDYLGSIYNEKGDVQKALEHLYKSLKIREEINHKFGVATCYNNIANIYKARGEDDAALPYYVKAAEMMKEAGDPTGEATTLQNLGGFYFLRGDVQKSLPYFVKALEIRVRINDLGGLANSYSNLGYICMRLDKFDSAFIYFDKGLALARKNRDKEQESIVLNNIGNVLFKKGDLKASLPYCLASFKLDKETGNPQHMTESTKMLAGIYSRLNMAKEALEMYKLHIHMKDSSEGLDAQKIVIAQIAKRDYEIKAAADSVVKVKEKTVMAAKIESEITQRNILYSGIGIIAVFSLFVVNRFRVTKRQKEVIESQKEEVEKQKKIVETKQQEVMESIHYARRIQNAFMSNEKYVDRSIKKLKKN